MPVVTSLLKSDGRVFFFLDGKQWFSFNIYCEKIKHSKYYLFTYYASCFSNKALKNQNIYNLSQNNNGWLTADATVICCTRGLSKTGFPFKVKSGPIQTSMTESEFEHQHLLSSYQCSMKWVKRCVYIIMNVNKFHLILSDMSFSSVSTLLLFFMLLFP